MTRIRIISDGNIYPGTRIETEDGEQIEGVTKITWTAQRNRPDGKAIIEIERVQLDVYGHVKHWWDTSSVVETRSGLADDDE